MIVDGHGKGHIVAWGNGGRLARRQLLVQRQVKAAVEAKVQRVVVGGHVDGGLVWVGVIGNIGLILSQHKARQRTTGRKVATLHLHLIGTAAGYGELVEAADRVGSRRGSRDDERIAAAGHFIEVDQHAINARFVGILHAIVIDIVPNHVTKC